jgi:hypothetical protein
MDHNNSHVPLTYDMQQMNSSFDIGNDPNYNSYRLTPRQMSDYSYRSGQFYNPNNQFNSFQGFTRNNSDQYNTMSYEEHNTMRNCYSVASLDGANSYSNQSFGDSSMNSATRHNKNNKSNANQVKGVRKRCPAQDEDHKLFKINIDNIIQRKDKRTTLMIRNIPNKYTSIALTGEINKMNKDRYNFFYLPIDFK